MGGKLRDGLTAYLFEIQAVVQELLARSDISANDKLVLNRRIESARSRYIDERRFDQ